MGTNAAARAFVSRSALRPQRTRLWGRFARLSGHNFRPITLLRSRRSSQGEAAVTRGERRIAFETVHRHPTADHRRKLCRGLGRDPGREPEERGRAGRGHARHCAGPQHECRADHDLHAATAASGLPLDGPTATEDRGAGGATPADRHQVRSHLRHPRRLAELLYRRGRLERRPGIGQAPP